MVGLEVARVSDPQAALRDRGGEVVVLVWSVVDFRTGELWDVRPPPPLPMTQARRSLGSAPRGWRGTAGAGRGRGRSGRGLQHKYLSGGLVSPAFIDIARRHQDGFDER